MKKEKQVCSLELARKLKKLNCKQESLFWWCEWADRKPTIEYVENYDKDFIVETGGSMDRCSAYTVAELGEMLHKDTKNNKFPFYCSTQCISRTDKTRNWMCFKGTGWVRNELQFNAEKEADARAKMLIYLIENKLLNK